MPGLTYQEAMAYLESFIRGPREGPGIKPDPKQAGEARLAVMAALVKALGDPQERFPSVHVAGTSGKGSTATFIASVLHAAGYRTGLHTSPYLQAPTEKLQIDGEPVSPQELAVLVAELQTRVERSDAQLDTDSLSFVPLWTALAFLGFAQRQVDYGVVEVSMGGRYDPTNVLQPQVAVVTNVGLDHLNSLGGTLREIAWHKAGIVKRGSAVVTGVRRPVALSVLQAECAEKEAPLYQLGRDITFTLREMSITGARFNAQFLGTTYRDLEIGLLGEHQVSNACLALGAVQLLRERGATIPEKALRDGLKQARIPGRLEVVQQDPLMVLDGAHNPEKARSLRKALDRLFPSRPRILVLGVGTAKDASGVLKVLAPGAQLVICTDASVLGKPAVAPEALARQVRALGVEAWAVAVPLEAVERALAAASLTSLVCVAGSLYLVGAVRGRWRLPTDYTTEEVTAGLPAGQAGAAPARK